MELHIDRLTKSYGPGPRALDEVTLHIKPGMFGLLGPNGAGKTTTLKLLLQLLFPTSGRAELLGRPAGDVEARRRLGYLPEHPYFYDYLTAEELLEYFGNLRGGLDRPYAQALAARFDLELERPIRSGAESFIAGTASCRIRVEGVDELYAELRLKDVLHPVSRDGVSDTDFGTQEFAALDLEGNPVTFFQRVPA